MRRIAKSVATIALAFPAAGTAQAQGQPQVTAQDQYPSFVQEQRVAPDGTQILLRCGYESRAGNIQPVPDFNDLTLRSGNAFTRYQVLDGTPVGATLDQKTRGGSAPGRLTYNVLTTDGVTAKSCAYDERTDTPNNCVATPPTMTAEKVKREVGAIESFCAGTFQRLQGQLSVAPAEEASYRAKSRELRAGHRNILNTLTK